jgi:DNA-binding GntR family transcriptional regulator
MQNFKFAYNHPMSDSVIHTSALYEQVAELIRQRIFSGELEPGSWIDELQLASAYGISRTPLREALKVLASEGLVTMKLRRGAYVTEVSEQDLKEVYHVLSLLESDAAADVARHATDAQLQELQALHQQLETIALITPPDRAQFFAVNQQFHQRLLEISGNRWRLQMVTDLRKVLKLSRQQSLLKSGRINESLAEHRAVLQALLKRDARASQQHMQAHIDQGLLAAA